MKKGVRPMILLGLLATLIYIGFEFEVFESHEALHSNHSHSHSDSEASDHHSHDH